MLLYAAAADLLRAPGGDGAGGEGAGRRRVWPRRCWRSRRGARPRSAALLHSFHRQTFEAFGRLRASGPFQYPNIAAMYLEAVVPIAVVLGAAAIAAPSRSCWRLGGADAGAVPVARRRSGHRVAGRAGRRLRGPGGARRSVSAGGARPAPLAPALLAVMLALAVLASGSALGARFRFWRDSDWYRAVVDAVAAGGGAAAVGAGPRQRATEILEVENQGALPWLRLPPSPVALGVPLADAEAGAVMVRDGLRTVLPRDLDAGEGVAGSRPGARAVSARGATSSGGTWFRSTPPGSASGATRVCASLSSSRRGAGGAVVAAGAPPTAAPLR